MTASSRTRRLFTAIAALALTAPIVLSAGQQTFVRTIDPSDTRPWPDAATLAANKRAAETRPLFAAAEPLAFALVADFGPVQRDRDDASTTTYPASIVVARADGSEATIPVRIRTRGHSRRKPLSCTFAPIRVEFESNPAGTVFEGQKNLKLGTHCRTSGQYSEYVVREYAVYRMFNLLTPRSFRARLADVRYVDAKSGKTNDQRLGLFIEDDDDVARRMEGRISDTTGLLFRDVDSETTGLAMIFQYMIGNTDASIMQQHNFRVVLTRENRRHAVPYDFDYAGVVDAQYAVPAPVFKLASVRDRLYRGPCLSEADLEKHLTRFRDARPQLYGVYDSVPQLKPKYVADAKKYLDQFFRTIDRPDSLKKAFIDGCNARPYM